MKYLGIDYGTKRVGLALSDDTGRIAIPGITVPNDTRVIESISAYARDNGVGEIVMGESVDTDGKPNPIMGEIKKVSQKLSEYSGLPLHFEKEWMTSLHARQASGEDGCVDASAAALILQRYLDKINPIHDND